MVKKKTPAHEPLPKRRRYDAETNPDKVLENVKVFHRERRHGLYMPTFDELYRAGYEHLAWAFRKLAYHEAAAQCGIEPDPRYYDDVDNLHVEIHRIFLKPQWDDIDDSYDRYFEPKPPSYAQLRDEPAIYAGVMCAGGITALFEPGRNYRALPPTYYSDDDNLKTELQYWMPRVRTKLLPTYGQIEPRNSMVPDAYLLRGGYLKTAAKLGFQPNKRFLKEPRSLYYELSLLEIDTARKEKRPLLDSGLPDCYLDMMPTEGEIRAFRRTDLHRAIEAMGGYFHVAKAINCWLPTRFWQDNPTLKSEMRRAACILGHPVFLPSPDELEEIGRKDLARAISHNGGLRKTAEMCGLRVQKSTKRSEKSLRVTAKSFEAYPFRRLSNELSEMIGDFLIRFEIPQDAKTGRGQVEEYGVWVFRSKDPLATLGRLGWVRRRPGSEDLWLHRVVRHVAMVRSPNAALSE